MTDLLEAHQTSTSDGRRRTGGLVRRVLASDVVDHLFAPHGIDRYLELVDPNWVVRAPRPTRTGPASAATLAPPAVEPGEATEPPADGGTVTFGCSGLSAVAEGTLLETAEAAGVAPRSRCRRGICGTCTTAKSAGRVRNLVTDEVSGPGSESIRLCVSVPVGDVTVDL